MQAEIVFAAWATVFLYAFAAHTMICDVISKELDLVSAAVALGARTVGILSPQEERLASKAQPLKPAFTRSLAGQIHLGSDPLGLAFCSMRSAETRRTLGATYTPAPVVSSMLRWAKACDSEPVRIVEPGAGSARFLMAAGRDFKRAQLVGVEVDPLPALLARANLAVLGFAHRSVVLLRDYRSLVLPSAPGTTLYIGNPPYIRHHQIDANAKQWLTDTAARFGHSASQLSGMHVYFYLATAMKAKPGDVGVFITAAEWLDVNYGRLVRQLFLNGLGGESLTMIDPTVKTFEDADATAAIATFVVGSTPSSIRVSRIAAMTELGDLNEGQFVHRGRLESETRWSHLMRSPRSIPQNHVELGELCRVHRGQVTGANRVWIAGPHSLDLPNRVLFRTVTRARELFTAAGVLADTSSLRDVIDLPSDLEMLNDEELKAVKRFLRYAKGAGADSGYIAKARRAWWSVGLRAPAPILATYMARRAPAFVRNLRGARHLNIAHGLYPRESFAPCILDRLAKYLSKAVSTADGRTYSGGLTKFEPREMERLIVPSPDLLARDASAA